VSYNAVFVVAGPWAGRPRNSGSIPGSGKRFVSYPKCPDRLWGPLGNVGAGMRGNEIAEKLARDISVQKFDGPELFFGVSRQNIRSKNKCCIENQHFLLWRVPCSTQTG